jgi:predicted phage terminase large subunit-like protein
MGFSFLPRAALSKRLGLYFQDSARAQTLPPLPSETRQERIERYADIALLPEWLKLYLPHAFYNDFERHHLVEMECFTLSGATVEVLLPRGFGKTTALDGLEIWNACYGKDQYVVRFEHDREVGQQKGVLFEQELLYNSRIQADYGIQQGSIWRPGGGQLEILNRNPCAFHHKIMLRCVGVLNISRGTNYNFGRIDRAVLNDVVKNAQEARSPAWNNLIWRIIKEDLGFAGGGYTTATPMTILFVTTIQASNDISDRLRSDPATVVYECPAVNGSPEQVKAFVEYVSHDMPNIRAFIDEVQGTPDTSIRQVENWSAEHRRYCERDPRYAEFFATLTSAYPAAFPMWDYVFEIFQSGSEAWLQERQHLTGDSKFQKFYPSWFQSYTEFNATATDSFVYGLGIDTSGSPREGTDPMAIVAGAYNEFTGDFYVLDFWCQQATPEELFDAAYSMFSEHFTAHGRAARVFLEALVSATGMGKALFTQTAIAQGKTPLPVFEVQQTENKEIRIAAMRPVVEQRRIFVNRHIGQQDLLVKQWCNWAGESTHKFLPIDFKVDGPDAMTLLYRQLSKGKRKAPAQSEQARKYQSVKHGLRR